MWVRTSISWASGVVHTMRAFFHSCTVQVPSHSKSHADFIMNSFSFEKWECTLSTSDIFWNEDMKHIVMKYWQVKLIALCILNSHDYNLVSKWLQKLIFESFVASVSSAAGKVHQKKLNFNPKLKKKVFITCSINLQRPVGYAFLNIIVSCQGSQKHRIIEWLGL